MNNLFALMGASIFFVLVGLPYAWILGKTALVERLGLSLILGIGIGTYGWFGIYLLGLPLTLTTLLLAGTLLFLIGLFIQKISGLKHPALKLPRFLTLDRILLGLIIVGLLSAFAIAVYNPITAWDSMALYDFRAHAIVLNHDLRDITNSSYYVSYPLLVSLLHATVYFMGGVNAQGMHTIMFAAFLAIIFGRALTWSNLRHALIAVALNLFSYEILMHSTIAYANLPYTIFLVTGFFYLVSGTSKTLNQHLVLGSVLIGLSTWVRSTEVFWTIAILLIIWRSWSVRRLKLALAPILLILILRGVWSNFHASLIHTFAEPPLSPSNLLSSATLNQVIANIDKYKEYFGRYIIAPYLGLWIMTIALTIASFKSRAFPVRGITFVILCSLGLTIAGVVIFSTYFPTWFEIGDSARRMLMFLIPLTLTAGTVSLKYFLKDKYDKA